LHFGARGAARLGGSDCGGRGKMGGRPGPWPKRCPAAAVDGIAPGSGRSFTRGHWLIYGELAARREGCTENPAAARDNIL